MSILIIKQPNLSVDSSLLYKLVPIGHSSKEIGVCWVNKTHERINRVVGLGINDLFKFLKEKTKDSAALIYLNNPDRDFGFKGYSPLKIDQNWAFASCGDMLTLTKFHDGKSNTEVFVEQTLRKVAKTPDIFGLESFAWMLKSIARSYVGMAFLNSSGKFVIMNSHLFKNNKGILYMDFDECKKDFLSKSNTNSSNASKTSSNPLTKAFMGCE